MPIAQINSDSDFVHSVCIFSACLFSRPQQVRISNKAEFLLGFIKHSVAKNNPSLNSYNLHIMYVLHCQRKHLWVLRCWQWVSSHHSFKIAIIVLHALLHIHSHPEYIPVVARCYTQMCPEAMYLIQLMWIHPRVF